jgi:Na+(H+)/acetate symporter ActP
VLGIWWRGLTAPGAIAGLIGGGLAAGLAPIITISVHPEGWFGVLAALPAAWSVPLGFALMVGVSLATRQRIPADVSRTMVRLHTPEGVELKR